MTESVIHFFIKNKIAEALTELGFETRTEEKFEDGILDISARRNNEHIKIEVIKTHIPDWIAVKIFTDVRYANGMKAIIETECYTTMKISTRNRARLAKLAKYGESLDDALSKLLGDKN